MVVALARAKLAACGAAPLRVAERGATAMCFPRTLTGTIRAPAGLRAVGFRPETLMLTCALGDRPGCEDLRRAGGFRCDCFARGGA